MSIRSTMGAFGSASSWAEAAAGQAIQAAASIAHVRIRFDLITLRSLSLFGAYAERAPPRPSCQ